MGTVLLVEDDEDIRSATAEVLFEEGYDVQVAANGQDALLLLRAGLRPCVTLLDLMMPIMSGYEFLTEVRADAELTKLAVVIVSASSDVPDNEELCLKPANLDTLFSAVARHCGRRL